MKNEKQAKVVIVPGKVQNPLRQLRKSLKRLPDDPSAESVHALRTRARRVEAVSSALIDHHKKKTRKLLKAVKPVRKAAGEVRDMDVLIANLLSMPHDQGGDSLVRLVEHLGKMRTESARNLLDLLAAKQKHANQYLKRYSKLAGKWLAKGNGNSTVPGEAPIALAAELGRWPNFTANNIHPFRIKVKELRYMLQLSADVDSKLLRSLDKVKDRIGGWHDWHELEQIAASVLNPRADRNLLVRIKQTERRKLTLAIAAANALREKYLVAPSC